MSAEAPRTEEGAAAAPPGRLARALGPPGRALRRRWGLALAVLATTTGLAAASLAALPRTWHVEALLLAERLPTMPALGHPERAVPREADAPTRTARDQVLDHQSLTAIARELDLPRRWRAGQAPLERLLEGLHLLVAGRPTEAEEHQALLELLRRRLYVTTGGAEASETVAIGFTWPDPAVAQRVVELAVARYLERRRAIETLPITEAIAILEQHADLAGQAVTAARAELDRRSARPGGPGQPHPAPARPAAAAPGPWDERRAAAQAAGQRVQEAEGAWRRQVAELEQRLAELRTVYSASHPLVQAADQARAALERPPREVLEARGELRALEEDRPARPRPAAEAADGARRRAGGRGPVADRPPPRTDGWPGEAPWAEDRWEAALADELRPPAVGEAAAARPAAELLRARREARRQDPELAEARQRLRAAAADRERLERRLDNARIELDVARAVFAHRYTVLRPPDHQREPARPRAAVVLLGGLLCGIGLGAFVAVSLEPTAAEPAPRRGRVLAVAAAVAVATVGLLAGVDQPAAALAPAALAALAWALWRAPLRHGVLALLFLMLVLEAPGDAGGHWQAPWAVLGHLLNTNLNLTLPIPSLRFAGVDLLMAALLLLYAWRRATGAGIDGPGTAPMPGPLRVATLASFGAIFLLVAHGLARGGLLSQVLWQVHVMAAIPVMVLAFHLVLRWPSDFVTLGKLVVAAAVVKAVQASWVRWGLGFSKEQLPTATSHADSMLFVTAFVMLIAVFLERRSRRSLQACLLVLPALAAGIVANNRRLAWVEIALVLTTIYLLAPRSRVKRAVTAGALVMAPLVALYVAVGWNASSPLFGPVAKLRSIVEPHYDLSAQARDIENYNLIRNLQAHPLLGLGFGHEYQQFVENVDISGVFPQWRFIPHNSVLGLLAFGGLVGFTLLWAFLTVALHLAGRAYRRSGDPTLRAAALTVIGAVFVYLLQCYGDMGLVGWQSVFLVAPAVAVAGKLAAASGAWPARPR